MKTPEQTKHIVTIGVRAASENCSCLNKTDDNIPEKENQKLHQILKMKIRN